MCSKVCVENLASNLKPNTLDELAMYLNPRMPLKDYKTLAGKLGYSFLRVRNFERDHNPTISLLEDWWTSYSKKGEAKTVSELIKILEEMKRDDAASLLRPYEFIGKFEFIFSSLFSGLKAFVYVLIRRREKNIPHLCMIVTDFRTIRALLYKPTNVF